MMARNVTTINRDMNPRLKEYLDELLMSNPMHVVHVHEGSRYEPLVFRTKAYCFMGIFYDYLIRKELHNLLGVEATDYRASLMEKLVESYYKRLMGRREAAEDEVDGGGESSSHCDKDDGFPESSDCGEKSESNSEHGDDEDDGLLDFYIPDDKTLRLLEKRVASYQQYKNPANATLDIIEHVFNTSMLHMHFFKDEMRPFEPELLNMRNVEIVLKHVGTLNRNNIDINPAVGCKYFRGDADLILDDAIFDIKVSMHPLKYGSDKFRIIFYQLILYALGVYVNEGKEIRKFEIYNPLLGVEYHVHIPGLDFIEYLKIVEEVAPL